MGNVIKVRDDANKFDLTIPESLAEVGVDGVSQVMFGFPTSKLVFHVLTPQNAESVEQRKAVLTLSIGTLTLLQLCQQTLGAMVTSSEQVDTAASEYLKQVKALLASISLKQPKQQPT